MPSLTASPIAGYPATELQECSSLIARLSHHIADLSHGRDVLARRLDRLSQRSAVLDDASSPEGTYPDFSNNPSGATATAVATEVGARSTAYLPVPAALPSQATRAAVPISAPAMSPSTIAEEFIGIKQQLLVLKDDLITELKSSPFGPSLS